MRESLIILQSVFLCPAPQNPQQISDFTFTYFHLLLTITIHHAIVHVCCLHIAADRNLRLSLHCALREKK